jgi:uncharacterized membrane protein
MSVNRRIVLGIGILSAFFFVVVAYLALYHMASASGQYSPLLAPFVSHQFEFTAALILAGVVTGALVFYLMAERVEVKQHNVEKTVQIVLKFLGEDEQVVVRKMLQNNGQVAQAELSRIENISRVKAHRIVMRLQKRGIVEVRKYGKVNFISLAPELKEGLMPGGENEGAKQAFMFPL